MGQVAERIVAKAGTVIASKDIEQAVQLEQDDDEMDELHRKLFAALLAGTWEHGIEAAVDITLVGRYYERFADHAVSVARRVVYLVTGEWHSRDHRRHDPTHERPGGTAPGRDRPDRLGSSAAAYRRTQRLYAAQPSAGRGLPASRSASSATLVGHRLGGPRPPPGRGTPAGDGRSESSSSS